MLLKKIKILQTFNIPFGVLLDFLHTIMSNQGQR
jgi:hypothetical protein